MRSTVVECGVHIREKARGLICTGEWYTARKKVGVAIGLFFFYTGGNRRVGLLREFYGIRVFCSAEPIHKAVRLQRNAFFLFPSQSGITKNHLHAKLWIWYRLPNNFCRLGLTEAIGTVAKMRPALSIKCLADLTGTVAKMSPTTLPFNKILLGRWIYLKNMWFL